MTGSKTFVQSRGRKRLQVSDVVTVEYLLEHATLLTIDTTELGARRVESEPDDSEEPQLDRDHALSVAGRADGGAFRVSLRTTIHAPGVGDIECEVLAEYEIDSLKYSEIPHEVLETFVNKVAVMALLPFVRQAIADITLRVFGSGLLMPIVQQGEVEFELNRPD